MNKLPSIFLSYNPDSEFEETLAVRLHTIGAVHGFKMQLPDRYFADNSVSQETKSRILLSDYFILFSTATKLSKTVKDEIDIAWNHLNDKSKVLVIYDKHRGKNLINADKYTEIYIDSKEPLNIILESIIKKIKEQENKPKTSSKPVKKDNSSDILGGILLAGLALLILGALLGGDSKGRK